MGRVCDEAWAAIQSQGSGSELDIRYLMASRVLRAVANGERDPNILKAIALELAVPA